LVLSLRKPPKSRLTPNLQRATLAKSMITCALETPNPKKGEGQRQKKGHEPGSHSTLLKTSYFSSLPPSENVLNVEK